jgi:transcriptional regulator with XRE-family HTH domain
MFTYNKHMGSPQFSEWLNGELSRRDINQSDLARGIGLGRSAVSLMLAGRNSPSPATATKIAAFFGIPESDVFRYAGISTARPTASPFIEQIIEIGGKLPIEDQEEIIEFIKVKLARLSRNERNAE